MSNSPYVDSGKIIDTVRNKPYELIHQRFFNNISLAKGWKQSTDGLFNFMLDVALPVGKNEQPITLEYSPEVTIPANANVSCRPSNFPMARTVDKNTVRIYAYRIPDPLDMLPVTINMKAINSSEGTTNGTYEPEDSVLNKGKIVVQSSASSFIVPIDDDNYTTKEFKANIVVTSFRGEERQKVRIDSNKENLVYNIDGTNIESIKPDNVTINNTYTDPKNPSASITVTIPKKTLIKDKQAYILFKVSPLGLETTTHSVRVSLFTNKSSDVVSKIDRYEVDFPTISRTTTNRYLTNGEEVPLEGFRVDARAISPNGEEVPANGLLNIRDVKTGELLFSKAVISGYTIVNPVVFNGFRDLDVELMIDGNRRYEFITAIADSERDVLLEINPSYIIPTIDDGKFVVPTANATSYLAAADGVFVPFFGSYRVFAGKDLIFESKPAVDKIVIPEKKYLTAELPSTYKIEVFDPVGDSFAGKKPRATRFISITKEGSAELPYMLDIMPNSIIIPTTHDNIMEESVPFKATMMKGSADVSDGWEFEIISDLSEYHINIEQKDKTGEFVLTQFLGKQLSAVIRIKATMIEDNSQVYYKEIVVAKIRENEGTGNYTFLKYGIKEEGSEDITFTVDPEGILEDGSVWGPYYGIATSKVEEVPPIEKFKWFDSESSEPEPGQDGSPGAAYFINGPSIIKGRVLGSKVVFSPLSSNYFLEELSSNEVERLTTRWEIRGGNETEWTEISTNRNEVTLNFSESLFNLTNMIDLRAIVEVSVRDEVITYYAVKTIHLVYDSAPDYFSRVYSPNSEIEDYHIFKADFYGNVIEGTTFSGDENPIALSAEVYKGGTKLKYWTKGENVAEDWLDTNNWGYKGNKYIERAPRVAISENRNYMSSSKDVTLEGTQKIVLETDALTLRETYTLSFDAESISGNVTKLKVKQSTAEYEVDIISGHGELTFDASDFSNLEVFTEVEDSIVELKRIKLEEGSEATSWSRPWSEIPDSEKKMIMFRPTQKHSLHKFTFTRKVERGSKYTVSGNIYSDSYVTINTLGQLDSGEGAFSFKSTSIFTDTAFTELYSSRPIILDNFGIFEHGAENLIPKEKLDYGKWVDTTNMIPISKEAFNEKSEEDLEKHIGGGDALLDRDNGIVYLFEKVSSKELLRDSSDEYYKMYETEVQKVTVKDFRKNAEISLDLRDGNNRIIDNEVEINPLTKTFISNGYTDKDVGEGGIIRISREVSSDERIIMKFYSDSDTLSFVASDPTIYDNSLEKPADMDDLSGWYTLDLITTSGATLTDVRINEDFGAIFDHVTANVGWVDVRLNLEGKELVTHRFNFETVISSNINPPSVDIIDINNKFKISTAKLQDITGGNWEKEYFKYTEDYEAQNSPAIFRANVKNTTIKDLEISADGINYIKKGYTFRYLDDSRSSYLLPFDAIESTNNDESIVYVVPGETYILLTKEDTSDTVVQSMSGANISSRTELTDKYYYTTKSGEYSGNRISIYRCTPGTEKLSIKYKGEGTPRFYHFQTPDDLEELLSKSKMFDKGFLNMEKFLEIPNAMNYLPIGKKQPADGIITLETTPSGIGSIIVNPRAATDKNYFSMNLPESNMVLRLTTVSGEQYYSGIQRLAYPYTDLNSTKEDLQNALSGRYLYQNDIDALVRASNSIKMSVDEINELIAFDREEILISEGGNPKKAESEIFYPKDEETGKYNLNIYPTALETEGLSPNSVFGTMMENNKNYFLSFTIEKDATGDDIISYVYKDMMSSMDIAGSFEVAAGTSKRFAFIIPKSGESTIDREVINEVREYYNVDSIGILYPNRPFAENEFSTYYMYFYNNTITKGKLRMTDYIFDELVLPVKYSIRKYDRINTLEMNDAAFDFYDIVNQLQNELEKSDENRVENRPDIYAKFIAVEQNIKAIKVEIARIDANTLDEAIFQTEQKNSSYTMGYNSAAGWLSSLTLTPGGVLMKGEKNQIIGSTSIGALYGKKLVMGKEPTSRDIEYDKQYIESEGESKGLIAVWEEGKWASVLNSQGQQFFRYRTDEESNQSSITGYMIMNSAEIAAYQLYEPFTKVSEPEPPSILNLPKESIFRIDENGAVSIKKLEIKGESDDATADFMDSIRFMKYQTDPLVGKKRRGIVIIGIGGDK